MEPRLAQLNLVVRDMAVTVAFYRRLRVAIEAPPDAVHAGGRLANGMMLELDTVELAAQWDTAARGESGGSTVLGFEVETRDGVDALYAELTAAGARRRQPAYDPFWGARDAMVEDPDGVPVGLMSPIDTDAKFWPPRTPPSA